MVKNESETTQKKDSIQTNTKQIPAKPQTRPSQPPRASASDLIEYLGKVVVTYGLDKDKFERTVLGESTYNSTADNGLSVGVSQFVLSTWLSECSKVDDRKDAHKALDCMGRMWSEGKEYHWDVYCDLFGDWKCEKYRGLYKGFLSKKKLAP